MLLDGKMKAIVFSYDDGTVHDRRLVELFNRYGVKGTFNLNSGLLGNEAKMDLDGTTVDISRIKPEEVATLYQGHEVAAHTLTHPRLVNLSDEEVVRQVETDRANLSQLCNYEVIGFAYPCGYPNCDERVKRLVTEKTNCEYARSIDCVDDFSVSNDLFYINFSVQHTHYKDLMRLGKQFIDLKPNEPQIFMIMGHSYELETENRWEKLEEFLKLISNKDDIFYGTCRQVFLGK